MLTCSQRFFGANVGGKKSLSPFTFPRTRVIALPCCSIVEHAVLLQHAVLSSLQRFSAFQFPSPSADSATNNSLNNRRDFLIKAAGITTAGVVTSSFNKEAAYALVEGNPPPSKVKKSLGEEYRQGTAALADSPEAEVLPRPT